MPENKNKKQKFNLIDDEYGNAIEEVIEKLKESKESLMWFGERVKFYNDIREAFVPGFNHYDKNSLMDRVHEEFDEDEDD